RAAATSVDLSGLTITTDANGLPIHGLLVGKPGWRVEQQRTRGGAAPMRGSIAIDTPAFPLPHRIHLNARAPHNRPAVTTRVLGTGKRRVPVAFGWHPYLRLPDTPRSSWTLRLPRRRHLELDDFGIPTGLETTEDVEAERIGRRTFDDLYALERGRLLAL